MIGIVCLILNLYYTRYSRSLPYLLLYQLFIILAISTFIAQGVDVTYKIDLSKPSDTAMYYKYYINPLEKIENSVFPIFIYYLRIIEYPFHNALFVVWVQSTITFFLIDLIVQNKRNLLFICFFHALIYTNTGMFKDNFIIIISLLTYLLIIKCKSVFIQSLLIAGSVWLLSTVRPFLINFIIPLSIIPYWINIKSVKLKNGILVVACCIGVIVWILMQSYISGIMRMFENDSSVIHGRASPPIALIKIVAGPTPIHYLLSDKFMVQPFSIGQSLLYCFYHVLYYFVCIFWIIYLFRNIKQIFKSYSNDTAKTFLLGLACAQGLVYVVIYGSADIRQRAIIILFLFLSTLSKKNIFKIPNTQINRLIFMGLSCLFLAITFINS